MTPTETVLTDQLALEIARLGMVGESSDVGTLHRVTELAARAIPGCAGAASVRWALPRTAAGADPGSAWPPAGTVPQADDTVDTEPPEESRPEPLAAAASHPDLAEVTDRQLSRGHGPVFDVVRGRRPLTCDDILAETRWPESMSDMLRRGCAASSRRRT